MTAREETTQEECYRLSRAPGGLGLHCEAGGVSLGGVALLHKTGKGFAPRPVREIEALIKGAYGQGRDVIRLTSGLRVAADALNKGDVGRAMIAAVQLRLPDLSDDGAALMARVDDILAKYSPDEPRDWRGRWTTGGAGSAPASADGRRPMPIGPAGQRRQFLSSTRTDVGSSQSESSSDAPVHLYGGRIIPVQGPGGIGGNGPPPEFAMDPEAPGKVRTREPQVGEPQVSEPTSPPLGYMPGDPNYPMNDGVRWPTATHDVILKALTRTGRKDPEMVIFVPLHGDGPILTGPEQDKDYPTPEGYLPVRLIGIPQVTRPVGRPSFHAYDSVDEALALAKTNQFGTMYFNRAWTTLTNGEIRSRIQHDVVAVLRPGLSADFIYHPSEVLSPGQTPKQQERRIPIDPRINPKLRTKDFRLSGYRRSPYFEYFDSPDYDA